MQLKNAPSHPIGSMVDRALRGRCQFGRRSRNFLTSRSEIAIPLSASHSDLAAGKQTSPMEISMVRVKVMLSVLALQALPLAAAWTSASESESESVAAG